MSMQEARLWHTKRMKLFTNASLPTGSSAFKRVNILFDEKIIKISTDEIITEDEPEIIDLKGKILLPGAIDIHSHIISQDDSLKEDLKKATKSAIIGGWTCLSELSYHTSSPIFSIADLKKRISQLTSNIYCDMALWGHVDVTDYPYYAESAQELWSQGASGICIMQPSPNDNIEALSFDEIMDLFMDIYESDTCFAFQGYDLDSSPEFSFEAQLEAIKKLLRRMQENPIHIPRVSSYPVIEFINSISKRSDISFALNISDLMHLLAPEDFPPLWETDLAENYDLFYELLRTNKIYILSNSTGIISEYSEIFSGTPAQMMEYSYLWLLSELWEKRKIPLATCLKMTSENPAKRLGIYPQKGRIDAGSDADFVVYNPEINTAITSPAGRTLELSGSFESVWLRGKKQDPDSDPEGTYLTRTKSPKRRHNKSSWI